MIVGAIQTPKLHRASRAVLAALDGKAPPPECTACNGRGTDRFGFDCTTCFGTGEAENE